VLLHFDTALSRHHGPTADPPFVPYCITVSARTPPQKDLCSRVPFFPRSAGFERFARVFFFCRLLPPITAIRRLLQPSFFFFLLFFPPCRLILVCLPPLRPDLPYLKRGDKSFFQSVPVDVPPLFPRLHESPPRYPFFCHLGALIPLGCLEGNRPPSSLAPPEAPCKHFFSFLSVSLPPPFAAVWFFFR